MSVEALRVVLLGKTGAGKSSLGNTLLGKEVFRVERGMQSGTQKCQWAETDDRLLEVTDTPGLFDTKRTEQEVLYEIGKSVAAATPGPHAVVMVIRSDRRFTQEEYETYLTIKKMFGEDIPKFIIVAFVAIDGLAPENATRATQLEELEKALQKPSPALRTVLSETGKRYVGINNKTTREERDQQASHLFGMVQDLVSKNGGRFLTSRLCEEMNGLVEALVQERMARQHENHSTAAAGTKHDIVEEKVGRKVSEKIVHIVRCVGECVGAFIGGIGKGIAGSMPGGKCSLM